MSVLVKICGINSVEAADAVVRAGAEYAGLNFHSASPRYLRDDVARALAERMRGRVRLVAVLANASDEAIDAALRATKPEFLQLHGDETPERLAAVRTRFGVPVIKAIAIADSADFAPVSSFEDLADIILFDAKAPGGSDRGGGHGAAFDWQLLRGRIVRRPWLLAGGLTCENVARAIATSGATGVDVSSGVEVSTGRKSADLIRDFVANARNAKLAEEARS